MILSRCIVGNICFLILSISINCPYGLEAKEGLKKIDFSPGIGSLEAFRIKGSPNIVDFDLIEKNVADDVLKRGLDTCLEDLKAKDSGNENDDLKQLLRRFVLFSRAGDELELNQVIQALVEKKKSIDKDLASRMADSLIDRGIFSSARLFLDQFSMAEPGHGYLFVDHWRIDSTSKADKDRLEGWLALKSRDGSSYWLNERLRYLKENGGLDGAIKELSQCVKNSPSSYKAVEQYMEAVRSYSPTTSLHWLKEVVKLKDSYYNYKLGQLLLPLSPSLSVWFYEHSLNCPFTDVDEKQMDLYLRKYASLYLPETVRENGERELRTWIKSGLAKAYQKNGQNDMAQAMLVDLSKVQKIGMPVYALSQMSGQVQAGTAKKLLEKEVLDSESKHKSSYTYWLRRSEYYRGRGDTKRVEEAFKKALDLTQVEGANLSKHQIFNRAIVVSSYQGYLFDMVSPEKAMEFLFAEFNSCPNPSYQRRILDMVWHHENDRTTYLYSRSKVILKYLDDVSAFDHVDEKVIRKLVESTPSSMRDQFFKKLVDMTDKQSAVKVDPSKAIVLGWIMTREGRSKDAIALLESAVSKEDTKEELLEKARFTLFEAYLNVNDWRSALKVWPLVREQLAPQELSRWLGKIAVSAARAGDKKEAFKIWLDKDNLDRTDLSNLEDLVQSGLRSKLRSYYKEQLSRSAEAAYAQSALQMIQ